MFEIVYNLILLTNIQHKFKLNFTDATKEELLKKVDLRKLKKGEKDVLQEFVEDDNITFMQYISKKYKYTSSQSIEFNENINNLTTEKVELAKEVLKNTKEVPEKHDSQSREELIKETSPTQELVKESSKSNMKKKKKKKSNTQEEPKFIENEEPIESIHSSEMKKKQESVNESQKSIEKTTDEENVETVESEEPPKSTSNQDTVESEEPPKSTKKKKKNKSNQESVESEEPPKSTKKKPVEELQESSELLLKPIETCYKKKIYYDNNKYYFSKEGLDNYREYFLCNFKDIYNETGEKINTAVISYRNPSDSELIQWDIFKTNLMVNEEDVPESENLVDIYINTDSGEISEFYKKNFKHMYVCNTYIVNADDLQYILEIQLPNN